MDVRLIIKNFYEIFKTIAVMFLMAFVIRAYIVQTFVVEGLSMEPNFHDGEYLLIDKISYRFKQPQRGEVIVFISPEDTKLHFIKRVIGLPGETVEITQNRIFVNNNQLQEDYLKRGEQTLISDRLTNDFKIVLPQDSYFVLGDNRQNSKDSRLIGLVPQKNIVGRAFIVIYPFKNFSLVGHPAYAGRMPTL